MTRLNRVANEEFDLLIVGAGIHGAALAWYAACAGLRVALIDRHDFGAAASANSLKILHGGLRYLQQFDIARMRESIRARRDAFTRLPYLTRPASFLLPVGKGFKRSASAYRVAAILNDIISADRNKGVPASHAVPKVRVWGAQEMAAKCPALAQDHSAAMNWHDGFIDNTERYTLAYVMSAQEQGAICLNYVTATGLLRDGDRVIGATVCDQEDGSVGEIRARTTVNAAGYWMTEYDPQDVWVRAYNIVVQRRWFGEFGVGLDSPPEQSPKRSFFFAPWLSGTMIGTVYQSFDPETEECALSTADLEEFVRDINRMYPAAELSPDEISFAHVGVQPAKRDRHGKVLPEPACETRILEEGEGGSVPGYWSIRGVKYTTAAMRAEMVMKRLLPALGRKPAGSPEAPLYGAERIVDAQDVLSAARDLEWKMSEDTARLLTREYGARALEVVSFAGADASLRTTLPGSDWPLAAIAHAVRCESALHLEDVVLRRTNLGTFAAPTAGQIKGVTVQMAQELGWSESRQQQEMQRLKSVYSRLGIRCP